MANIFLLYWWGGSECVYTVGREGEDCYLTKLDWKLLYLFFIILGGNGKVQFSRIFKQPWLRKVDSRHLNEGKLGNDSSKAWNAFTKLIKIDGFNYIS